MRYLFALLALCLFAAPAAAQDSGRRPSPPLSIALGEMLTLRVDETAPDGYVIVERTQLGAFTRSEIEAAQQASQWTMEQAGGVNSMGVVTPEDNDFLAIDPGLIRIRFGQVPGSDQVLLVIQNGYADAFAYRAVQHTARGASPTDVCWVLPNHRSFEHWPYVIDSLDLSNIRLYPWADPGARPPCQ